MTSRNPMVIYLRLGHWSVERTWSMMEGWVFLQWVGSEGWVQRLCSSAMKLWRHSARKLLIFIYTISHVPWWSIILTIIEHHWLHHPFTMNHHWIIQTIETSCMLIGSLRSGKHRSCYPRRRWWSQMLSAPVRGPGAEDMQMLQDNIEVGASQNRGLLQMSGFPFCIGDDIFYCPHYSDLFY